MEDTDGGGTADPGGSGPAPTRAGDRGRLAVVLAVVVAVVAATLATLGGPTDPAPTEAEVLAASSARALALGQVHRTQRACSDPRPGAAVCHAIKQTDPDAPLPRPGVVPNAVTQAAVPAVTPAGWSPADLRSAYRLPASGSTATIAIIDAYDDPNAEADLATYRSMYGLPACTTANGCFRKVNQSGATAPMPPADAGWAGEISLDLDMASATCPTCRILLVESSDAYVSSLGAANNTAIRLGAKYVSNSWGTPDGSSDGGFDTQYFRHPGVVITASSGDSGWGAQYPATSPYVTAVGGTTLSRSSSARGWVESAWSSAGSGCSSYEAKPAMQLSLPTGCSGRAEADVAAVSDPQTGVAVYQTYGAGGWQVFGGTSTAAPIIAGVYALAGAPGANDTPNAYPYAHPTALNDVTAGSNGSCGRPLCAAVAGFDGPTGLGTPNGTGAFVPGIVPSVPPTTTTTAPPPTTTTKVPPTTTPPPTTTTPPPPTTTTPPPSSPAPPPPGLPPGAAPVPTPSAITSYYGSLGGATSYLGAAVGPTYSAGAGALQMYAGGTIYWSAPTGAHALARGTLLTRYLALGGPTGPLGFPTTDQVVASDGRGRTAAFANTAALYWNPAVDAAVLVTGRSVAYYDGLGGPRSTLGYPRTDTVLLADGRSFATGFAAGGIYASVYGPHAVAGAIYQRWLALGAERGSYGLPITDEMAAPGGRRQYFVRGSLTWSATTGTVSGTVR